MRSASRMFMAMLCALVVVGVGLVFMPTRANAVSTTDFEAGYILSDEELYRGDAMSAGQIQSFLDARVPRCRPDLSEGAHDPIVCLKDYSASTVRKDADRYCTAVTGGQQLSAARLIDTVARACGISQEVLLVMLQKETSLVTMTAPSQWRYERAMGFACPDDGEGGAVCRAERAGFFNQVYYAARQFQVYRANPTLFGYQAGRVNKILLHDIASRNCGTRDVYIENAATAALYIYTPYVPNEASLRAGRGEGDRCSSYGNRNFFINYAEWFGSPSAPIGAIGTRHSSMGGNASLLGPALSPERKGLRDGGATQNFRGGSIHWSRGTGAHWTKKDSAVQAAWRRTGWENGSLGYPVGGENGGLRNGGVWQGFESGKIHWSSSTGAHWTKNNSSIQSLWSRNGWENGTLGYPTTDENAVAGGVQQSFEGGRVSWSSRTGAQWTKNNSSIQNRWLNMGAETSALGFPVTAEVGGLMNGGVYQRFEGGQIHWSGATGAHWTKNNSSIQRLWASTGWERGFLGYPLSGENGGLRDGGVWQSFQGGRIHWSASTGSHWTKNGSAIQRAWSEQGWENGRLGYPTSSERTTAAGVEQDFQGGTITWTRGGGSQVSIAWR